MIYLDTHVLALLYAGRQDDLPAPARTAVEGHDLLISPMVGLELQLLFERGRTLVAPGIVLEALSAEIGLAICDLEFSLVAARARELSWTRDPFDRVIVAHAMVRGAPLVTRDRLIRERYEQAIWERPLSD